LCPGRDIWWVESRMQRKGNIMKRILKNYFDVSGADIFLKLNTNKPNKNCKFFGVF
jgi:hypothetical protein